MKPLADHPLAALMPAMTDDEYALLREDIASHGLLSPIVTLDGLVLDGRHRLRACAELGIEPQFEDYDGDDPLAFVVGINLYRRHLTIPQRAMLAVEIEAVEAKAALERMREGGRKGRPGSKASDESAGQEKGSAAVHDLSGRSDVRAAAVAGVSPRSVATAKKIAQQAPDVAEAVKAGALDLSLATRAAALPAKVRPSVLTQVTAATAKGTRSGRHEAEVAISHAAKAERMARTAVASAPDDPSVRIEVATCVQALDLVEPASVDLIFTDPPYHDEYLDTYADLGQLAVHALKPGCHLMVYVGGMFLPEVLDRLRDAGLEYIWTIAIIMPGATGKIARHKLFDTWRPLVVFRRPGDGGTREWCETTVVNPAGSKSHHPWEQGITPALKLMPAWCPPNGLVLDPFSGGGTFAVAARQCGMRVLAFDADPEAVATTQARLAESRVELSA